jgi:hypothetical protein
MATRLELRTSVRTRLEDGELVALFNDTELNDMMGMALAEYGRQVPLPSLTTTSVTASATSFPLPAGVLAAGLVGIRDAQGAEIPPMIARFGREPEELVYIQQAWRVWANTVRLARAVAAPEAGLWSLDHLAPRVLPAADGDQMPIEPGDESVVVELTLARVYERRSFEDYKRGADGSQGGALAQKARDNATAMLNQRNRRARGGFFDVV